MIRYHYIENIHGTIHHDKDHQRSSKLYGSISSVCVAYSIIQEGKNLVNTFSLEKCPADPG